MSSTALSSNGVGRPPVAWKAGELRVLWWLKDHGTAVQRGERGSVINPIADEVKMAPSRVRQILLQLQQRGLVERTFASSTDPSVRNNPVVRVELTNPDVELPERPAPFERQPDPYRQRAYELAMGGKTSSWIEGVAEFKCPDCDYQPRPDSKNPAQSLFLHRRRVHQGMPGRKKGLVPKPKPASPLDGFRVVEGMILLERISDGALFVLEQIK